MARFGTGTKIVAAGALVLLLSSFAKASNLVRLGNNLIIDKDFAVKFEAGRLTISITPTLKNPSAQGISLRHPFIRIKLREDGPPIATSQVQPTIYDLKPFTQLSLQPVLISLSPIELIQIGTQVGKDLFKTKKLTVFVDTIASITGEAIPFDSTEKFELKLPF